MQKPSRWRWRAGGAVHSAWQCVAAAIATASTAFAAIAFAATAFAADTTLPQYSRDKHLGVASCASGVCHGSVQGLEATHVLQNEYVTWTQQDKHASAYQTLLSERSRKIARNLGLPNAQEATICLDCHADNVPQAQRGDKFQINDGIGCEGCHGGAERWLSSHASNAQHQDSLELGMYPTNNLRARADLCLSCHLGTDRKFATHRIMGAGHPRLAFELDTFGALQPQHYRVDADYAQRKGSPGSVGTWLAGLVTAAQKNLELVQGPRFAANTVFPEIALFDCHACHHPMSDQRWQPRKETARLGPGEVRLNDANLVMLASVTQIVAPRQYRALIDGVADLHAAVRSDRNAVIAAARRLSTTVGQVGSSLTGGNVGDADLKRILGNLFKDGQQGEYRDYVSAEQAVMAVDLLLIAVGRKDTNKAGVDRLYATVADENRFDAAKFADSLAALQQQTGL